MKKILFMVILGISSPIANAQDILVRKGGEVEEVKILEVSPSEVKYKKSDNEDSPVFIERCSNLYSVKYKNGEVQMFNNTFEQTGTNSYYLESGKEKKFSNELGLYVGTGWGIGYQLRREFNPYVGWNIFGISYIAETYDPTDEGMLNLKLLGVRGNTPSYKWFRGYADLNLGYSFEYDCSSWGIYKYETDYYHSMGIELCIGIQVHKYFTLGCDYIFTTASGSRFLGARLSCLF